MQRGTCYKGGLCKGLDAMRNILQRWLISLAKAGLQAKEAKDDTGRLSELIALAEVGL